MKDSLAIGSLMNLLITDIKSESCTETKAKIATAAKSIKKAGRNWIPVIVQDLGHDTYKIVANSFILAATQEAGLERVWAIIIKPETDAIESAKILANENPAPLEKLIPAPTKKYTIQELKKIAQERGITPKGDKRLKATWLTALSLK